MSTINEKERIADLLPILNEYRVISLHEMEESHLMSRFDEKYIFHASRLHSFLEELKPHYRLLSVNNKMLSKYENIYFDTADLKSYHDHHNGKCTRYKVRFRRYTDSGHCFLEVKKKTNRGFTNKARIPVSELRRQLDEKHLQFISERATGFPQKLQPSLSNYFHRITLVNSKLRERVTLDLLIHFQNEVHEKDLNEVVIAEVKQEQHFYDSAFKKLMQRERFFPISFSKYCMGTLLTHPGIKYNRFKPKLSTLNKICDGIV